MKLIKDYQGYLEIIDKWLLNAQQSVWITTANLKNFTIPSNKFLRRITIITVFRMLVEKGVEIRILHSAIPSYFFIAQMKKEKFLFDSKLFKMKRCRRIHFKTILVDSSIIYIGSANFTGAGIGAKSERNRNFELGIISQDDDTMDCVKSIFDKIWKGQMCTSCGVKEICAEPLEEFKLYK